MLWNHGRIASKKCDIYLVSKLWVSCCVETFMSVILRAMTGIATTMALRIYSKVMCMAYTVSWENM